MEKYSMRRDPRDPLKAHQHQSGLEKSSMKMGFAVDLIFRIAWLANTFIGGQDTFHGRASSSRIVYLGGPQACITISMDSYSLNKRGRQLQVRARYFIVALRRGRTP
eukprot:8404116-Pyramimonas_sp.AAC.1